MATANAAAASGPALVDHLAEQIQSRIIDGRYRAGEPLRQDALATEYGVSRTPVREALRRLQESGLIEVLPNRGAVVRAITPREIREAYVVRAELEGLAAELAAEHINDAQLQRLGAAEELFRTTVEATHGDADRDAWITAWSDANDRFHVVVLEAARNDRLLEAVRQFHRSFLPRNLTGHSLAGRSRRLAGNVAEHADIFHRIAAGDGDGARDAMKQHVLSAGRLVAERLEDS